MLNITLNFDAQALAAPQSFRDGMEAAVRMLERHVLDDINVNISVGYGELTATLFPPTLRLVVLDRQQMELGLICHTPL